MAAQIRFYGSPYSVYVDVPTYGYTTTTVLATRTRRDVNGRVLKADFGYINDYTKCSFTLVHLTADQVQYIEGLFRNYRSSNFTITLDTNSGFYPFGCDHGCSGTFTVNLLYFRTSERLHSPLNRFNMEITLKMVEAPAYTLPSLVSQGSLQIGSVTGLPWPKVSPVYTYNARPVITNGGSVKFSDLGLQSSYYDSNISVECNYQNTGHLLSQLKSARNNSLYVSSPDNSYIFGVENGGGSIYSVKVIDDEIETTHISYNRFLTTINLHLGE